MYIDDLRADKELINKLDNGEKLTAKEQKRMEGIKTKWGLSIDGTVSTIQALADELGVTRRTVARWKSEGMPVEPDGTYDVVKVSNWHDLTYPGKTKSPEEAFWETEFRKYRAKLSELSYRQKLGELIPVIEVDAMLVDRAVEFKRALLYLARRISLKGAQKDPQSLYAIVEKEAINILEIYSREPDLGEAPKIT